MSLFLSVYLTLRREGRSLPVAFSGAFVVTMVYHLIVLPAAGRDPLGWDNDTAITVRAER